MSTSTTNLGLTKPSGNERPDVDIINANMDTIDAAIGAVGNVSLQSQITSLQESVSQKIVTRTITQTNFTLAQGAQKYFETDCPAGYAPLAAAATAVDISSGGMIFLLGGPSKDINYTNRFFSRIYNFGDESIVFNSVTVTFYYIKQ